MIEATIFLFALIALITVCMWWSRNEWKIKAAFRLHFAPPPPTTVTIRRRKPTDDEIAEAYLRKLNRAA